MGTIIFWVALSLVSAKVLQWAYREAANNVMGYEEKDGELVRFADPDHYTYGMTFASYYAIALFVVAFLYVGAIYCLGHYGYAEKFSIQTGFKTIKILFCS